MKNLSTKRNALLFTAVFLGLTMVSCSDIQEPQIAENSDNRTIQSDYLTIDEAIKNANDFLASIDNKPTRSHLRTVASVEYIKSESKTRSLENDTLMYLINYSDNHGFALVGKSRNSRGIYAISPEGSLNMSDTVNNKGLAIFVNAAIQDASTSSIVPITGPEYVYQNTRQVSPLLPANITKWHQHSPYNKYCPINPSNNNPYMVGCGPLAVGMFCSYYQFPYSIAGNTINWQAINNNNNDNIARLLADIGSEEYLNAFPKSSGERAIYTESIAPFFTKIGFDSSHAWEEDIFSNVYHEVFDFMKSGKDGISPAPILMSGHHVTSEGVVKDGHVWIIDGFIERKKIAKILLTNPYAQWSEADPYLHCIWGWGSLANGYYLYFIDDKKIDDHSKSQTPYPLGKNYSILRIWGAYTH